jgi:hypothetical protein
VGGRLLSGAGAGRGWAGFRRFWLFDADWFRNLGGVCRGIALKSFRYDNKHGQGIDKVGGGAFPPPTLLTEFFASFFKKKRFADPCFHRERWITPPPGRE